MFGSGILSVMRTRTYGSETAATESPASAIVVLFFSWVGWR